MVPKIIDNKIPHESAEKAVEEIIGKQGYVKFSKKVTPGSKVGDNYVGIVYRVSITGIKPKGNFHKLDLIVKVPPSNEARREQFKIVHCFQRESFVYNEVLPTFTKFQEGKHLRQDLFKATAKCYITSEIEKEEFLIMEDLKVDGFTMFSRHNKLDFDHVKLVMEQLGKFHAFSFAMKDQQPSEFEKFAAIQDVFFTKELPPNFEGYMSMIFDKAMSSLEETDVECLEKMSKLENQFYETGYNCVQAENNEKYSVVNHGDCWNNNILFKYQNKKPVDIRFLDWQICRYASPVLDIVYYIFCCTDKPFRDAYYTACLDTYYKSLSNFLKKLGSNPEQLFPRSAFDDQLKQFGKFGLYMCIVVLQGVIANVENVPDMDNIADKVKNEDADVLKDFNFLNESTEIIYKSRMSGVIQDMVRLGYL